MFDASGFSLSKVSHVFDASVLVCRRSTECV